jgi:hypothetical protein
MKNINLFLVTLLALFFIACNNEPIDPALNTQINNTNTTSRVFTANLNGLAFSDPIISVIEIDFEGQEYIAIGGARANDRMNINIKSTLGVGTYPITGVNSDNVQAFYVIINPAYSQRANIGVITVTEKTSTRIKGTFNFSTPNTTTPYVVTSGNFDVELP